MYKLQLYSGDADLDYQTCLLYENYGKNPTNFGANYANTKMEPKYETQKL